MCRNEWGRKLHFRDAISGYYGLQSAIVGFDPIHLFAEDSIKYPCVVNNLTGSSPANFAREVVSPCLRLPKGVPQWMGWLATFESKRPRREFD